MTEPVHPDAPALLHAAGFDVLQAAPESDMGAQLAQVDAVLVRTRKIDAAMMANATRLALISKHGVGVDNIDLAAAAAAGIAVANTPGANAGSVAEHTLMLILALARGLPVLSVADRPDTAVPIRDLDGMRLLVIGYGQAGRRVAALAAGLGMQVRVHGPRLAGTLTVHGHTVAPDLDLALATADVVTLHCPLTETTRGMIGAAQLARMPQGAIVINTARGGLVDEVALAAALQSGQIGGAGLDVLEHEPIRPDEPLRNVPRCILTPHVAAMGQGAFRAMGLAAAQNIIDHFGPGLSPLAQVVPALSKCGR